MILRILVAATLAIFLATPVAAQSLAADACDALAGHPEEPGHEGRGVEWGQVNAIPATLACRMALAENPNSPEILYRLARTLMQVEQYDEALPMVLRAAEAGYGPAETAYGTAFMGNQGVEIDYAVALHWLTRAADSGHSIGQYNLGLMYEQGWGTPADFQLAEALYLRAVAQGYTLAMINLGLLYERGEEGVPQDWNASFALFSWAAEKGVPAAVHAVGRAYSAGRGTQRDDALAFEWWMRAASAGFGPAQLQVSRALLNGLGVEADLDAALSSYRYLASRGNAAAQVDLGRVLVDRVDPSERMEGISWLKRAGDAGDLEGYQYLAEYYAGNNLLPLARHYAGIVSAHGDDRLKEFATSLLATLDGLETRRRKAMPTEPAS